eukprot:2170455-Pyramimonas_sp.AAC.1
MIACAVGLATAFAQGYFRPVHTLSIGLSQACAWPSSRPTIALSTGGFKACGLLRRPCTGYTHAYDRPIDKDRAQACRRPARRLFSGLSVRGPAPGDRPMHRLRTG